jgi:hypothetical protein
VYCLPFSFWPVYCLSFSFWPVYCKDRQHNDQTKKDKRTMIYKTLQFEDTKGVIRSRKSKKDRQHNDQL